MNNAKAGLYIHIPFCLSKCSYCSFYSVKSIRLIPEYIKSLQEEMKFYARSFSSIDTVYIGGGTPSVLSIEQIAAVLAAAAKHLPIARDSEITVEVNPGDVSPGYLEALHDLGINRLNLGIQSFRDEVLKLLGRRHSAEEAYISIAAARRAGFHNIGIDLISGINGVGYKLWKDTLRKAVGFAPEHISCYQLTLNKKSPLYKKYSLAGIKLPDEKTERNLFFITSSELENSGYIHYEVSNFSRGDEFRSRHNMKYWHHMPYLGLGPAAHSFLNGKRWWNKSSVIKYLTDIKNGVMPVENYEVLSEEQLRLETIFLGLRTKEGIDLKAYQKKYGTDFFAGKESLIADLLKNKLIKLENGFILPTRAGMAVADSLALI